MFWFYRQLYSRRNPSGESLGRLGYTDFFLTCAKSIQKEEVVKCLPVGKKVTLVLEQLCKMEACSKSVTDIAVLLVSKISACVAVGNGRKLPSAKQALLWSTFHQLCSSAEIKEAWSVFLKKLPRALVMKLI